MIIMSPQLHSITNSNLCTWVYKVKERKTKSSCHAIWHVVWLIYHLSKKRNRNSLRKEKDRENNFFHSKKKKKTTSSSRLNICGIRFKKYLMISACGPCKVLGTIWDEKEVFDIFSLQWRNQQIWNTTKISWNPVGNW